ncbi:MAG: hypothetical protein ACYS0K_01415 [Planctomycetota bacterium]|jgi:hypothetical protein
MQDVWFKPFDGGGLAEAGTTHREMKMSVAMTRTAFDSYPLQGDGERGQQLILTVLERDLQALPGLAETSTDAGALELLGYRRVPDGEGEHWRRTLEGPEPDGAAWTSFVEELTPREATRHTEIY